MGIVMWSVSCMRCGLVRLSGVGLSVVAQTKQCQRRYDYLSKAVRLPVALAFACLISLPLAARLADALPIYQPYKLPNCSTRGGRSLDPTPYPCPHYTLLPHGNRRIKRLAICPMFR